MSAQNPLNGRGAARFPALPKGDVVEEFASYAEAQSAVDKLARADFPVKRLVIIGNDLKTLEVVTGKMSYGRAALGGAASGAWLGIFLGLMLFIFSPTTASTPVIFAALLIGAGFGVLFGIVNYSIKRKRRNFSSVMQVVAVSYTLQAPSELVHRARNLLRGEAEAPALPVYTTASAPTGQPSQVPPPPGVHHGKPDTSPDATVRDAAVRDASVLDAAVLDATVLDSTAQNASSETPTPTPPPTAG